MANSLLVFAWKSLVKKSQTENCISVSVQLEHEGCDVPVNPSFSDLGMHDCHGLLLTNKNEVTSETISDSAECNI